jgi:hypothetical protein
MILNNFDADRIIYVPHDFNSDKNEMYYKVGNTFIIKMESSNDNFK